MASKIEALKRLVALIASGLSFGEAEILCRAEIIISDREWAQICVAYHASYMADLKRRKDLANGLVFLTPQAD